MAIKIINNKTTTMKTKKEISLPHLGKYYRHKGREVDNDDILPISRILPMMDEYAKEVAIEFNKWVFDNFKNDETFGWYSVFNDGSHGKSHISPNFLTTEELYNLFLKTNNP